MKHLPRIGFSLAGLCFLSTVVCAQQIVLNVNGQNTGSESAQIEDGVTLVPLRTVSEALGAQVQWNQENQSIDITRGQTDINMSIGSRNATVNGQNTPLDVPAQVVNGQTLVPLRFIAESFGCYVNYDPMTHSVNINSPAQQTETIRTHYNLERRMAPLEFTDDASGWVTSGTPIHFSLNAEPGGQATVVLPGLSESIAMQETSPGHYEATWTPPSDTPLTVNSETAMAKFEYNGQTYYSGQRNLNLNNQPPEIESFTPAEGETISGYHPMITVNFGHDMSGIDTNRVRVEVNGNDVTPDAQITGTSLAYTFPHNLPPGVYHVRVTAYDRAGNKMTRSWSFTTTGGQDTSDFTITGPRTLRRGDEVEFSLRAAPGSQVTVNVADGPDIPLTETSPGVFTGEYRVRDEDRFGGNVVRATIVPPNGESYTIRSNQNLGISGDISPRSMVPVISSPLASDVIGDDIVVEGSAPPASTVDVHITYVSRFNRHSTVTADLGDFTVTADTAGNFETRRIHIPESARHARIRITATTELPDGTQSEPSVLELNTRER